MKQYIVEHDLITEYTGSRTTILFLPSKSKVYDVLQALYSLCDIRFRLPYDFRDKKAFTDVTCDNSAKRKFESLNWKLQCYGKFLHESEIARPILQLWTGGLKGGKGGFGAMLRAAAKQSGTKATRDFGACRDLQGRRLRHVNDEIRLRKWFEEREKGEQLQDTEEDETERTPSGIENWHLGVPSWAEGLGKQGKQTQSYLKPRRKTCLCKQWLEARENRPAPEGAPIWWGCPRGRGCDFAHGEEELRGTAGDDLKKRKAVDSAQLKIHEMDSYVKGSVSENLPENMADAVQQGIIAAQLAKKQRVVQKNISKEEKLIPMSEKSPVRISEGTKIRSDFEYVENVTEETSEQCSWLGILSGNAKLEENGQVCGSSEFGTVFVRGVRIRKGKWYYEVKLVTNGIIQMGWADHNFKGDSIEGNGIGDDVHSWAYDGSRQKCWNGEENELKAQNYGLTWKEGDVIGCWLDADAGTLSFSLNGTDMGVAFNGLGIHLQHENPGDVDCENTNAGYFPALSLEYDEKVIINAGALPFSYDIPHGFFPICNAMVPVVEHESKSESPQLTSVKEMGVMSIAANKDAAKCAVSVMGLTNLTVPPNGPINLLLYDTASELHMFGLDRLKKELQDRGVKCGGTLHDRAARLFELKNLDPSQYPEQLLASKPKIKCKKEE